MSEASRRALSRSRRGAVVWALGWCAASPLALAREPPAPKWLVWRAPAECQNTSEVERRLQSLLGHPVDAATLPATRVRMGWSPERGWAVRVTVQLEAGPRDRELDAPSCADAFNVIALSLALILEPSFDPGAGAIAPEASADGGAKSAEPVLVAGLEPGPPQAPDAAALIADSEASQARGEPPGGLVPASAKLVMGAGPLTDLAIFPVAQFGGGAYVGLVRGPLSAELEGALLASESTRFAGAQYPVSFYSLSGALRGCYTLDLSARFGWAACVGGEMGSLGSRERGGEQRRAHGLWLAGEVSTGPQFAATRQVRAFARVRGVSPLFRHEFLLSEGSRVHELPWFSPQLQVGVAIDVTDLGAGEH